MINPVIRINQKFTEGNDIPLIVRGEDKYIYDDNGKRYLDFTGGIWNMPLGYTSKEINDKVKEQIDTIPFCNLITNIAQVQHNYAKRLNQLLGTGGVLYTCSGSESVEAAIKACRKYQTLRGSKRKGISAFDLSYHGTTYAAMSVSGLDQDLAEAFYPLLTEINWIEVSEKDLDKEEVWIKEIEKHFQQYGEKMAGIIIEPVFASGGIIPFPQNALKRMEQLCREYDVLLVDDEVTTGFGRTGNLFAYEAYGIEPDLICLSKGITNGFVPLGVLAFSKKVCDIFAETGATFEHFSTQGGNLLSVAAADAVIDIMEDYKKFHVEAKGIYFKNYLEELFAEYKEITVRGAGLMVGISLPESCDERTVIEVWEKLKQRGILVYIFLNGECNRGLSFFPPYIVEEDDLKYVADKVLQVLKKYPGLLKKC